MKKDKEAAKEHEFYERCCNDNAEYFSAENSFLKGYKFAIELLRSDDFGLWQAKRNVFVPISSL